MQSIDKLVHDISFKRTKRLEIFLELPYVVKAQVLINLSKRTLEQLLSKLEDQQLVDIVEHLDPDQATDIIQNLGKRRQERVLDKLKEELRADIKVLSRFDPETAAGLMNIDYIQVDQLEVMSEVASKFQNHEKRTGRLPIILVMKEGKLIGYLPVHTLGLSNPKDKIEEYVKKVATIDYDADYKSVIKKFKEEKSNRQVIVIGDSGQVLGVIYTGDILRIIESQESASLYDFAGVQREEFVLDPASSKIKHRYKWLMINLATAFLAAFTVSLFDETISKYVLLAIYMPIVAGMGGNAATQTLAVLVRGITLHQIDLSNYFSTLWNELKAAFVNGVINGIIVAAIVIIFNNDVKMALVLGSAMIINLIVAAFFGTMVPLIMKKLGKDPATSATIFITTATDVLGFLAFLGLATIVLG